MFKALLKILAALALVVVLGFAWLFYGLAKPDLQHYQSYSQAFFSDNGQLLRLQLAKDQRYRLKIPLKQVAKPLITATVLYEDKHFYQHSGVDFTALVRAAFSTYISQSHKIGASTLTMQVAKLRFGIASHTVFGKLQQIARAWQLEYHYSKNDILQAYFNLAPYGRNIEGVQAASFIYFHKPASALNMAQALSLAVIPQNPNKRYLASPKGQKNALAARTRLWQNLAKHKPQFKNTLADANLPIAATGLNALPYHAPHFIDFVSQQLGYYQQGRLATTLNLAMQKRTEQTVAHYIDQSAKGFDNASVLVLNYKTMAIKTMVGSANFFNNKIDGQVNATLAKRSPGSTLKPFVYALALEQGLIHSKTLLSDAPKRFAGFTPENYDQQFLGPVLATDALILSRNVPAVNLQHRLGKRGLYQLLVEAKVQALKPESHYGLALSLGGGELSMLELVQLYAALANQGQFQQAQFLQQQTGSSKALLTPEASFIVLDMLRQNPNPFANAVLLKPTKSFDVAWKTGTSWAFRDAWSIAVAGDYIVAVWLGHFDGRSNQALVGRQAAAPLLFTLLAQLNIDSDWRIEQTLLRPANVKTVSVCATTGGLYQKYCPVKTDSLFIPGVSPIAADSIYRKIAIDEKTGRRLCPNAIKPNHQNWQVFAFWPTEFLHLFEQAGIALKKPPAFLNSCNILAKEQRPPRIISPTQNLRYLLNVNQQSSVQLLLKANADGDVKTLYWFANQRFLGSVAANKALPAHFAVGEYQLKVVDDHGNAGDMLLQVESAP